MKRWLALFFGAMLGCAVLFAAYNVLLDPFGVFGDPLLGWYEYDMTMNPRVAKIAYLDRHHEEYDAYVVGSSKASSLPVAELNAYYGARFYNMTWYGGDIKDENALVHYLLDRYEVKRLILTVDPQDTWLYDTEDDAIKGNMHCRVDGSSAPLFYGKYLFCNPAYGWDKLRAYLSRGHLMTADAVYVAETGCYNKQLRDVEPLADPEAAPRPVAQGGMAMPHSAETLALIADVVEACRARGVALTVVGVPIHNEEFYAYDEAQMRAFWAELAALTDFWDFWGDCSVNADLRYYYDVNHFRNAVGRMVLARICGDPSVWVPEDFGRLTTAANVSGRLAAVYPAAPSDGRAHTARVPVLMYHAFTDDPSAVTDTVVPAGVFASHLAALRDAGYTAVSCQDLIDYVSRGKDLPEKPILLTFDDGYRSNLTLAAPLLEQYGMRAEIAVVGVTVGAEVYKDTGVPMANPHFTLEEAAPWRARGVIGLQTHSYDMHQVEALDGADCRRGVLPLPGEREADYLAAFTADLAAARAQLAAAGVEPVAYAYPYGLFTTLSEVLLAEQGVSLTFTTEPGGNVLVKGLDQTLRQLKRINVDGGMTAEDLLQTLAALDG